MEDIFGKIYNKKRLAPGGVTRGRGRRCCCTIAPRSAAIPAPRWSTSTAARRSACISAAASWPPTTQFRADVVKRLLDAGSLRPRQGDAEAAGTSPRRRTRRRTVRLHGGARGGGSTSITIPLTVTVSLGDAARAGATARAGACHQPADDGGGEVAGDEAVAEDYRDREGYQPDFLGSGKMKVALADGEPRCASDVLEFEFDGKTETELKYMHYSVVMSRSRRMCFFSAVNIDGNLSKKSARVAWKWDPRIPKAQQIMNECYGNPPKFSRGHMTRREDPGWGNTRRPPRRGNEDSMHVTNTTPQMQAFNAPIWLALEDYALQHAREDDDEDLGLHRTLFRRRRIPRCTACVSRSRSGRSSPSSTTTPASCARPATR